MIAPIFRVRINFNAQIMLIKLRLHTATAVAVAAVVVPALTYYQQQSLLRIRHPAGPEPVR